MERRYIIAWKDVRDSVHDYFHIEDSQTVGNLSYKSLMPLTEAFDVIKKSHFVEFMSDIKKIH